MALLNIDNQLLQLSERIKNPEYLKQLVRRYFIDNPHRVRLTLSPDAGLAERKLAA